MKIKLSLAALFGVACFLLPSLARAQAWAKPQGTGFYKMDFSSITASNIFNAEGEVVPSRTIGNYITSFYGEYGITDKLTVVTYVPFFVRNVAAEVTDAQTGAVVSEAIAHNAFGDWDLGFRYALPIQKVAVAANLMLGIPTGDATQSDELFTGDGEFNQLLKVAVGTGGKRWWTQGAVGFNNRTNDFSDEFRYDFEFGYKFFNDRLLTVFKINGVESFENGSAAIATTGLYSNNVEYIGIGAEFLYYLNKTKTIGVAARLAGAGKSQNILAAPSLSFGVFAEL